jgi:hypothetical protein
MFYSPSPGDEHWRLGHNRAHAEEDSGEPATVYTFQDDTGNEFRFSNTIVGKEETSIAITVDVQFVGTARLASDSFTVSPEQQKELSHGTTFFAAKYGVKLDAVETWETPHAIETLAARLEFVKNPTQWLTYLGPPNQRDGLPDYCERPGPTKRVKRSI